MRTCHADTHVTKHIHTQTHTHAHESVVQYSVHECLCVVFDKLKKVNVSNVYIIISGNFYIFINHLSSLTLCARSAC